MKSSVVNRIRNRAFTRTVWALCFSGACSLSAQIPHFTTVPAEGEMFEDLFRVAFTTTMRDPISIRFEGTGSATFGCAWNTLGGIIPNQLLDCSVTSGELPSDSVITWTINPEGLEPHFQGASGTIIPTSSGTFTTGTVTTSPLTFTVSPDEGQSLVISEGDPAGTVLFTFNQAMEESAIDILWGNGVSNDQVNCSWNSATVLACDINRPITSGTSPTWEINPNNSGVMQSIEGTPVETSSGSFFIDEDGLGPLTVSSLPMDGDEFNPLIMSTLTLSFSVEMEDPISVSFDGAEGTCSWFTFPGVEIPQTTLECTFTTALEPASSVYWTVNPPEDMSMQTTDGRTFPETTGYFIVAGEPTGGGTGDPAPLCLDDFMPLNFPKRTYICGAGMTEWNSAFVFPAFSASGGYFLNATSLGSNGTFPSLVRYDSSGMPEWRAILMDAGSDLAGSSAPNLVFAAKGGNLSSADLEFGVFDASNGFSPVFQNLISPGSGEHSLAHNPGDGSTVLLKNLGDTIEIIKFTSSGAVNWARELSSDLFFPTPGSTVGDQQTARLSLYDPGNSQEGYLLEIVLYDRDFAQLPPVTTTTVILARLTSTGDVQWARRLNDTVGTAPTFSIGRETGSIYGRFFETTVEGQTATFASSIVKISSEGSILWSKEFDGISLNVAGELPNGDVILSGNLFGVGGTQSAALVLDDANGNLLNQTLFGGDSSNFVVVSGVSNNRIYYSVSTVGGSQQGSSTAPAIIGYSSLGLSGFNFFEYSPREVDSSSLVYDEISGNVIFSAFRSEDTAAQDSSTDIVALDADLMPAAPDCELFTVTSIATEDPGFTASNATFQLSNVALGNSPFSPTVGTGNITLATFDASEVALCENGTGSGDCLPTTLTITRTSATEVSVQFIAREGCTYILRKATALDTVGSLIWTPVGGNIPGAGVSVDMPITIDDEETYFLVETIQ